MGLRWGLEGASKGIRGFGHSEPANSATPPPGCRAPTKRGCRAGRIWTLSPERGCLQPQQHRPRNFATVFRDPSPYARAAAEDSRAPTMSQNRRVVAARRHALPRQAVGASRGGCLVAGTGALRIPREASRLTASRATHQSRETARLPCARSVIGSPVPTWPANSPPLNPTAPAPPRAGKACSPPARPGDSAHATR